MGKWESKNDADTVPRKGLPKQFNIRLEEVMILRHSRIREVA